MRMLAIFAWLAISGMQAQATPYFGPTADTDYSPTLYFASQNWSPEERNQYYFTAQGSKIIPYTWALALKAKNGQSFFSSDNLRRYGYIAQKPSALNPNGLPVGFMRDEAPGGYSSYDKFWGVQPDYLTAPQLGINCAACHTSELTYKGKKLRIDGGTSYSNFQQFVTDMDEAILTVASDRKALIEFVKDVSTIDGGKSWASLTEKERETRVQSLNDQVQRFADVRRTWQKNNGRTSAGIEYGPGRNDAFGVIFNQTLGVMINQPENIRPPNAPVKYPVIWDAPFHDVVQWVGIARNSKDAGGPIARNIGQVLGVFGHTDMNTQSFTKGYCTSAKRGNLNELEEWVRDLRSPTWPAQLFGFDVDKARRGQKHYQRLCSTCHALNERTIDEGRVHKNALGITDFAVYTPYSGRDKQAHEQMRDLSELQTDPLVAENAYSRTAKTGDLKGRPVRVIDGRKLEDVEAGATVLRHLVAGSILGSFSYITCANTPRDGHANWSLFEKFVEKELGFGHEDTEPARLEDRLSDFKAKLSKYKARPLNGIWAAPPYLHNGSVRSLKQLLTPPEDRESTFAFNCNEFDPVEVGLNCAKVDESNRVTPTDFNFETRSADKSYVSGNANSGHAFGTRKLSEVEKLELIEYIKSL